MLVLGCKSEEVKVPQCDLALLMFSWPETLPFIGNLNGQLFI